MANVLLAIIMFLIATTGVYMVRNMLLPLPSGGNYSDYMANITLTMLMGNVECNEEDIVITLR